MCFFPPSNRGHFAAPQAHVSGGAVWEVVGHLGTRVLLMDICPLRKVLRFYNLAPLLVCSLLWDCWCYVRSGPRAPGFYYYPIMMDAGTLSQNKPLSPLNCFCWCLNTVCMCKDWIKAPFHLYVEDKGLTEWGIVHHFVVLDSVCVWFYLSVKYSRFHKCERSYNTCLSIWMTSSYIYFPAHDTVLSFFVAQQNSSVYILHFLYPFIY